MALLAVALALGSPTVEASHDLFQYKFPCRPADACYVTTLTHTGNAFDFDPQGGAGLGTIPAVSEGTFIQYVTDSDVCTTSGLGMYALIDDVHGRTLRYAHLSAFGSLQTGQRVLQGDTVGVEGNTGYAIDCAPHLHLEGIATVPGIDGFPTSQITAGPTLYQSTNSFVSGTSAPAQAIRQRYISDGATFGSWAVFGWTADRTGTRAGCGLSLYCRLYIHYHPQPIVGHAGSKIEFRDHAEGVLLGGQSTSHDFRSLMVGRWGLNDARKVELPFHLSWLFGALVPETAPPLYREPGPPLFDRIGTYPGLCPSGLGCVRYQRFHVSYIWEHETDGVQGAVFCPDVVPYYPEQNYAVAQSDVLTVAGAFGLSDPGPNPYSPWVESFYDLDGSGGISLGDVLAVAGAFGQLCYPTP